MGEIATSLIMPVAADNIPLTGLWLLRVLMGVPGLIVGLLLLQTWQGERSERAALYWAGAGFAQFLMMLVLAVTGVSGTGAILMITGTGTTVTALMIAAGGRLLSEPAAPVRSYLWGAALTSLVVSLLTLADAQRAVLLWMFAVGAVGCAHACWHCRALVPRAYVLPVLLALRVLMFVVAPFVVARSPANTAWVFVAGVLVFAAVLIAALNHVLLRRAAVQRRSSEALGTTEALLRVANDVSAMAAAGLPLAELARRVVTQLHEVTRPVAVMLHDFDPERREFQLLEISSDPPGIRDWMQRVPANRSRHVEMMAAGETVLIADIHADPHVPEAGRRLAQQNDINQQVLIPIHGAGHLRGALSLLIQQRAALPDSWVQAAGVVARSVALALQVRDQFGVLQHQATHDTLTGLLNRAGLHEEFERRARETPVRRPALMLIDLDRFKEVNDAFGHQLGDRLIRAVAERLQGFAEEHKATCVRLGGDEFALLLGSEVTAQQAAGLGDGVQGLLSAAFEIDAMRISVGASIGIALCEGELLDSHELLRRADVAMYHAKTQDWEYSIYESALDPDARERMELVSLVHAALECGQFRLCFQPKVRLHDGAVVGAEALIRWHHPERGWIAPARFVPLLELGPLINQVSLWVAQAALEHAIAWRRAGIAVPIAINISPRNLLSPAWCSAFLAAVRAAQLPPGSLEIEITETSLMSTAEYARARLEEIAAAGIGVAIDDFGTGYSSLSYLQKLAIDTVKIDRSFVTDLAAKPQDAKLAASIVSLAKSLDLAVVAEGIEDAATHTLLGNLGCDIGQGYYYSRPLPGPEFEAWLRDWEARRAPLPAARA